MIANYARTVPGMLAKSVPGLFAAVLAAVSIVATAQTATKARTVGLLDAVPTSPARQALWDGFREQMRQLGYRDGQNVTYDFRSSEGDAGKLNTAAAALAERKADVIVAPSTQAALAARRASSAIPIVVVNAADPV
ncbi:MAG TPA: ABC transporter substrate binding protein, partial [Burkholderiales bacterium]|nr:ABC transporter substrate binding protein [Burkholderiales bacterium]